MTTTWLILANATRAYTYDVTKKAFSNGDNKVQLLETHKNPEGRLKGQDIYTDGPGRYQKNKQTEASDYSSKTTAHDVELEHFAVELANYLEEARTQHHYECLVICIEPHFSGILEKHLSKSVQELIVHRVHKDYVPLPEQKRRQKVEDIKKDYVSSL